MDFKPFKNAVAEQFKRMSGHNLFRVAVSKDWMWETYLGSFPPGTNPIHIKRAEFDCNCCRGFIKRLGNVVAIIDGKVETIWDVTVEGPFQVVANAMAEMVRAHPIESIFLSGDPSVGKSVTHDEGFDRVVQWEHFFVNLPANVVKPKDQVATLLSAKQGAQDSFSNGLRDISVRTIDTALELVAQKKVARGEEHVFAMTKFKELKQAYEALPTDAAKRLFIWDQIAGDQNGSATSIRSNSIGTLLLDLGKIERSAPDAKPLEGALRAFAQVMSPTNYQRSTKTVGKNQLEAARETLEEQGLTTALERRYAVISDININDVLFADRTVQSKMKGDVFAQLIEEAPRKLPSLDKAEQMSIEHFLQHVLPTAQSIELLFENDHAGNLVSLIAPADPTARRLFKWENGFGWNYKGDYADSIKERVKKAGGNVTGDLCCRLAWWNTNDLDLWVKEPNGNKIFYGAKLSRSGSGGNLDVDMNVSNLVRNPVENIVFPVRTRMLEGIYELGVHNYTRRETKDVGFEVEIDFMGKVHRFVHPTDPKQQEHVTVVTFAYSHTEGFKVLSSLPMITAEANGVGSPGRELWGIKTGNYHKVSIATLSPNHWDGAGSVGNKHYFFILEGCANPDDARGFFNEYLRTELTPHRKAFEMVGEKLKVPYSKDQLSGLGFSSTQRAHVYARIKGKFESVVKIVF